MKTKEELNALKEEVATLNKKLHELSDEELEEVCAGVTIWDIAVKLKEKFNISTRELNNEGIVGAEKQEHGGKNRP